LNGACEGQAAHAYHRGIGILHRFTGLVLEAAKKAGPGDLHSHPGGQLQVHAPHERHHVDAREAGRETGLAEIELATAGHRPHLELARYQPAPLGLECAHDGRRHPTIGNDRVTRDHAKLLGERHAGRQWIVEQYIELR
jgi:hypothetical protein